MIGCVYVSIVVDVVVVVVVVVFFYQRDTLVWWCRHNAHLEILIGIHPKHPLLGPNVACAK